jgi:dipeptidyl aminopeptidase/acylaminoacyl peptidase
MICRGRLQPAGKENGMHYYNKSNCRSSLALVLLCAVWQGGLADVAPGYREPSAEVTALLTTERPPEFSLNVPSGRIALMYREAVIDMDRLMTPRQGLAGYRFDPDSHTSGIQPFIRRIEIVAADGDAGTAEWRPANGAVLDFVEFSPDGRWLSALAVADGAARLVLFDLAAGTERVVDADISAAWGKPCSWATGDTLLCRVVAKPAAKAPAEFAAPMVVGHEGDADPQRTWPNLLKNAYDDALFEHYFSVGFARIGTDGRVARVPGLGGLIEKFDASPDGAYAIVTRVERPFSRLLPARRFPSVVEVWDLAAGRRLYESRMPADHGDDALVDGRDPPRRASWKAGPQLTLGYIESSDGADGDRVHRWFEIDAPFTDPRREVTRSDESIKRFGWTSAGTPWYTTASEDGLGVTVYASAGGKMQPIWSGTTENQYETPGHAMTAGGAGGPVLEADGVIFLAGDGRSDAGPRPFLDAFDFGTGKTMRLYEAEQGVFERVIGILDPAVPEFVTVRETETDAPRLFVHKGAERRALTPQSEPYPQLAGVSREVLRYQRADGVGLSGTLYLPANYRKGQKLPTLVWIYPYEFTDQEQAEQLDLRNFRYHQVKGPSPLAAVVAGYAVLMNPTVPIMYEGSSVNDGYLAQLVSSLEAAVGHLVELGVSDPARMAVGGRSYGSFSSANLLIHSELFATAVCMSGAYNRTLTPFGFQHEKRSFWEAGEMYADISPFFHADQVKKPIILIHGGSDENAGTPPMQARRFVHALIGEGATVRYVELPAEGHHYWARENVLLAAAEMLDWLDLTIGTRAGKPVEPATLSDVR